jgi:hypothetical protein
MFDEHRATYHDQNAIKNPSQLKKKTRPWTHTGLSRGKVRALLFIGLTSGAVQRVDGANMMDDDSSTGCSGSKRQKHRSTNSVEIYSRLNLYNQNGYHRQADISTHIPDGWDFFCFSGILAHTHVWPGGYLSI